MNRLKLTGIFVLLCCISGTLQYHREDISLTYTDESHIYNQDSLNKEITFYDTFAGENNHSFAFLKCSDFSADYPGKCILTTRTHYFGNHEYTKKCNVKPPEFDNRSVKFRGLTFLRGDRVLVAWKENHNTYGYRMALQVIFTNDCTASHFIHTDNRFGLDKISQSIIRNKDSFDIISRDTRNCLGSAYCKVTYDYSGEPVSSVPQPFSSVYLPRPNRKIDINGVYPMSSGHPEDVVIIADLDSDSILSEDIYSSALGWVKAEELHHFAYAYSNANDFATLCWKMENHPNQLRCKWLDGSSDDALNFDLGYYNKIPKIYNTEDGNLLLIMAGRGVHRQRVVVEEVVTDRQCKRLAEVAIRDTPNTIQFSFTGRNRLCLSFVASSHHPDAYDKRIDVYSYNFTTTCVAARNHYGQGYKNCAHEFLAI